jgi:HAD superfamily hydrolase (TIGR01509 family)
VRRALIFDFDGTLAPTEEVVFSAWRDLFAAHGYALPVETWTRCVGGPGGGFDPLERAVSLGFGERAAIAEAARARIEARLVDLTPSPGAPELLSAAERRGALLGVASGSSARWVLPLLARFGWRGRFGTVRTRDDGPGKPDPALYALALADLRASAAESWAVEDSGPGVLAAKAAGLRVVAVPHPLTVGHDLSAADMVVPSLAEVPLARLFP